MSLCSYVGASKEGGGGLKSDKHSKQNLIERMSKSETAETERTANGGAQSSMGAAVPVGSR
jgi:hypothetical protein